MIRGMVGAPGALMEIAATIPTAAPAVLAQGFGFLPLEEEEAARMTGAKPGPPVGQFELLTTPLLDEIRRLSLGRTIAYIETEYFGGTGGQGAFVCRDGALIMAPEWGDGPSGPISRAMAILGVRRAPGDIDEFEAAGLGEHRVNDDWPRGGEE